jgi:hypothetical protein
MLTIVYRKLDANEIKRLDVLVYSPPAVTGRWKHRIKSRANRREETVDTELTL